MIEPRECAISVAAETLHEFVPFPLFEQDKPDHVCKGGCAGALCSRQKSERAVHYQTRDVRRPKVPA